MKCYVEDRIAKLLVKLTTELTVAGSVPVTRTYLYGDGELRVCTCFYFAAFGNSHEIFCEIQNYNSTGKPSDL